MLTQYPSHGALYVRSHDTYMCFYMYGSPNKNVVIVPCSARSEAQDRNNVASNFEEIWMLSGKNTGLIASIIKEYQTDTISNILPSFRLRDKIIQVKSRWCLKWLVNGFWSNLPRSNTVELYSFSMVLEYDFSQNNTIERKNVVAKFLVFSPHITQSNSTQSLQPKTLFNNLLVLVFTLDHWGQYYWTDQYCYKLEAAFSWRTDCSHQLGIFCSFETWIKGCELRHDSEGDILNQSMRENELILISIINGKCKIQIQCCQYNGDFHWILIIPYSYNEIFE